MIDKTKYPKLFAVMERTIGERERWLREAKTACELFDSLPEEIKIKVTSIDYSEPSQSLSLNLDGENGTVKALKLLGVQGLKPIVSVYSKDHFYTKGNFILPNGCKVDVFVNGIEKPENCRVEEKTVTKVECVLVCEKTGEPI